MQGYGHDELIPYAWWNVSWAFRGWMCIFCGVFVGYFVGVGWVFTECSQRVRYLYVTYSPYKSMVFAVQKYGFWRAKVWFLHCKSMVFVFWMLCCCKSV